MRARMTTRFLAATLAAILLVGAAGGAHAQLPDPFAEHLDRASYRLQNEQYEEALKELRAAYAIRQQPRLLLEMARVERRLGHAAQALDLYRRWRASGDPADEATQAEASAAIAALAPEVQPPAPAVPPLAYALTPPRLLRYEDRPRSGLVVGGAVLFSLSYSAAALSGGAFAALGGSSSGSSGNLSTAGGLLFIPFIGPFAAAGAYRSVGWSVPWAVVDGTAQLASLVMMICGRHLKEKVPVYGSRIHVAPYSVAGGGGVAVSGRF
jgi:hypothetical protein